MGPEENYADTLERRQQEMYEESLPILAALRHVGYSEHDWEYGEAPNARVVAVLMEALGEAHPAHVRSWAARILGQTADVALWDGLVDYYRATENDDELRESLAASLAQLAKRQHLMDVMDLLTEKRLGTSRVFFLSTLARLRISDRWEIIEAARRDPDLQTQATHMLRQRANREARPTRR